MLVCFVAETQTSLFLPDHIHCLLLWSGLTKDSQLLLSHTDVSASIMSGEELYSTIPTTSPEPGLPASTADMVTPDWFAASVVSQQRYCIQQGQRTETQQTPFPNHYMTPFSTAPLESQKWSLQPSTQFPELGLGQYSLGSTYPLHTHFAAYAPNRPRSSPSSFGPAPESINWPSSNALGIQFEGEALNSSTMLPPTTFDQFGTLHQFSAPNTPDIRQPAPRRAYASIAPNPSVETTPTTGKRKRDSTAEASDSEAVVRRRKRTASVNSADLSEDDRYLVQLKEDESLPWKDIASRFQSDKGKSFQVAALQMRYKRLRERYRLWEEQDLNALKLAHEYWQKYKWEIISQKVSRPAPSTADGAFDC